MREAVTRPLSERESTVLVILTHHVGQARAMAAAELATATGYAERDCQKIIKRLIETHGVAIGSSCIYPGGGYWLIQTPAEMWRTRTSLLRRALSILKRVRAYDRAAWVEELLGQLEFRALEEEGDGDEGEGEL